MTKFLCRNTVSVASHFDSCRDNFFWSPSVCVATTISCRDLVVFSFIAFRVTTTIPCHDIISVVTQFDPWSQPPFHVATSFLVLCLHASCNSKLMICLFSYRDMGIRSRPGYFFSYYNSCRDLKSMSRPFFLPIALLNKSCFICQSTKHLGEQCPTLPTMREMLVEQANVVGQFKPSTNTRYGNTYNPSWKNHQNLS